MLPFAKEIRAKSNNVASIRFLAMKQEIVTQIKTAAQKGLFNTEATVPLRDVNKISSWLREKEYNLSEKRRYRNEDKVECVDLFIWW